MEQIALMALPREATDDSDAESACTTQENSSHAFIGSKGRSPRRSEGRNAGISVSDDELDAYLQVNLEPTSSYWSVQEQAKFLDLLHQFGSDFGAIAESMKTKSATMVKNFYTRKIAEGEHVLYQIAQAVDSTKLSTEEDDRAHTHLQPSYDPQVYSSDTSPGPSASIPIPKNQTYVRPQHPKVFCDKCNIKPEGFRGPHELGRHMEHKHPPFRTVWICVDRSPDKKFLSKCKPCNEGKQYGAYYNAAAHLRRIHFVQKNSKPRSRGREGNGGGVDPPMEILKLWIQEVSVSTGPQTQRSYETQNSPYHLENDTIGAAAAAAAAGNQLEMNSLEGIDEQETGISNTALDLQTKVPDHVDFAPNTEPLASQFDAADPPSFGVIPLPEERDKVALTKARDVFVNLYTAVPGDKSGTSFRDYQYAAADNKRPTTSSASLARLNTGDHHAPPPGTSAIQIGAAQHPQIHQTQTSQQPEQPSSPLYFYHWQPPNPQSKSEAPYLETPNRVDPFAQQADVSVDKPSQGRSPQDSVKKTRERRMLAPSQRKQIVATRRIGACIECRRRKKRCPHGLLGNSMNPEDPTETPTSLTTSKVPINDPLPHTPQTTKPTSEAINNPIEPTNEIRARQQQQRAYAAQLAQQQRMQNGSPNAQMSSGHVSRPG